MEARYPIRPCGTIVLCAKQQSDLQEKEKKRKEKKRKEKKRKEKKNAKRKEKKRKENYLWSFCPERKMLRNGFIIT